MKSVSLISLPQRAIVTRVVVLVAWSGLNRYLYATYFMIGMSYPRGICPVDVKVLAFIVDTDGPMELAIATAAPE